MDHQEEVHTIEDCQEEVHPIDENQEDQRTEDAVEQPGVIDDEENENIE